MKNKKMWIFIGIIVVILVLNHIFGWSAYLGNTENLKFLENMVQDNLLLAVLIYTVEGGAKALADVSGALTTDRTEENIDWQYVSGKDAVAAVDDKDVQILDVRDDDTYKAGHLKGSFQCGLKEIESADAQTAMYKLATEKMDSSKKVYLLCYSGNKCAKTGISILKDAGFDLDNLYIIENGAKDGDVSAAFVTE